MILSIFFLLHEKSRHIIGNQREGDFFLFSAPKRKLLLPANRPWFRPHKHALFCPAHGPRE